MTLGKCRYGRFQLTPARSGRRALFPPTGRITRFNSRPRAAGDEVFIAESFGQQGVSTHARAQRATSCHYGFRTPRSFQLTPRAAVTFLLQLIRIGLKFKLTPARSGRQPQSSSHASACAVSTHARAQRATVRDVADVVGILVSTHARAQRATFRSTSLTTVKFCVSTHARAQRATRSRVTMTARPKRFQLTPARSGRRCAADFCLLDSGFNSRPRAAGDRA